MHNNSHTMVFEEISLRPNPTQRTVGNYRNLRVDEIIFPTQNFHIETELDSGSRYSMAEKVRMMLTGSSQRAICQSLLYRNQQFCKY